MNVLPIPTSVFHFQDSLTDFIVDHLQDRKLQNGDVLAITSKIVSLAEGRLIEKSKIPEKEALIREEADVYIGKGAYECHLTIKHGLLIPSAGVDESNSESDSYILFPKDPFASAEEIYFQLKERLGLERFGILITDSHTTPLRRGVTGIALAHFGFKGVKSLIQQKDIFGRPLQFTYINHADALATMAVYLMGEANEQIPMVILRGRSDLEFSTADTRSDCLIPAQDDLYLPLLMRSKIF